METLDGVIIPNEYHRVAPALTLTYRASRDGRFIVNCDYDFFISVFTEQGPRIRNAHQLAFASNYTYDDINVLKHPDTKVFKSVSNLTPQMQMYLNVYLQSHELYDD